MIFHFLISIVFIAELVIGFALILYLVKLDKKIVGYNLFLEDVKPIIKELCETYKKLSEYLVEAAPKIVNKIKLFVYDFAAGQLKSFVGAVTFWLVKKEVEKHV